MITDQELLAAWQKDGGSRRLLPSVQAVILAGLRDRYEAQSKRPGLTRCDVCGVFTRGGQHIFREATIAKKP